jgi:L-2-hydroxyglutarate oxidase LhgO
MGISKSGQVVVIGVGVVGAAIAAKLAKAGYSVIGIEKNPRPADGVTSRNSGVIHAGLYYPKGSLKAESCLAGFPKLYEWCTKHQVPHKKLGKWIVGRKEDESDLQEQFQNALDCGASGLRWGATNELAALAQKGVLAEVAFFSEHTGIVDPYLYTRSFLIEAEENGATFLLNTEVTGVEKNGEQLIVQTGNGEAPCDLVINAAGLYGDEIHQMMGFNDFKIYPYRGDYFRIRKKISCDQLIYPAKKKNSAGLGVHLTLELDGACKLGPDVNIVSSKEDFSAPVNLEEKRDQFWESARKFLPALERDDLVYDTCGIRPKLRAPQEKMEKDFVLKKFGQNYIAALGIESPGLTAAIDLADRVLKMV